MIVLERHYHGTIRVEQDAAWYVASQNNKNILLISNDARAVSVPSLEVLTNEVQCFHGSASGRCDDEQLFYLQSRGIDKKQAHRLLLQAFFAGLFVDQTLNDKIDVLIKNTDGCVQFSIFFYKSCPPSRSP